MQYLDYKVQPAIVRAFLLLLTFYTKGWLLSSVDDISISIRAIFLSRNTFWCYLLTFYPAYPFILSINMIKNPECTIGCYYWIVDVTCISRKICLLALVLVLLFSLLLFFVRFQNTTSRRDWQPLFTLILRWPHNAATLYSSLMSKWRIKF